MRECPTCHKEHTDEVSFCPYDGASLAGEGALGPGSVIRGKYELLAEIGRGGMGVVFRARHLLLKEPRAIKILLEARQKGSDTTKSFLAEALVLRQFKHPNIVRVEDVDFTERQQLFVVMEFIEGEDLRKRLRRTGPMSEQHALSIAIQACAALEASHQRGIIHRDVKPHNILLAADGSGVETVKLIDFGIAKVRDEAQLDVSGMLSSSSGMFLGTPDYASPEQALGLRGSELDGRSDLYSLGLVLYEMLTAALPFAGDSPLARLIQRQTAAPPRPEIIRPDLHISAAMSAVVMKALAKDRANRYRSAGEMKAALSRLLPSAPAPEPESQTVPVFLPEQPPRRINLILVGVVMAILLAAGSIFLWPRAPAKTARADVPKIHYFRASPELVRKEGFAVLSWDVENASQVVIEPGLGAVPTQNHKIVRVSQPTTFTLSAKSWSAQGVGATQTVRVDIH